VAKKEKGRTGGGEKERAYTKAKPSFPSGKEKKKKSGVESGGPEAQKKSQKARRKKKKGGF